ncbi:glycosyltransferase [Marinobacter sp. S0848L]|uniref:glycosyltransferase n=1 Tax=Marinobacter sp. S0848L TaxID=2926423 RepID=UPI001FF11038|nr:glycosyltransferase [Marinobacter sp. S0848L]MCK0107583.1 glycosyltransferase [Marinobacter sp. S0848L]
MNVLMLMLSDNPGIGGLEKHTRELACALSNMGHQISVAAAPQHLEALEGPCAIPVEAQRSRNSPALLFRLVNIIREGHYQVIHAQGTKAAFVLQRLAPFIKKYARVASIHGFKSRYPKAEAFHNLIAVSKALANDINYPKVTVVYNGTSVSNRAPAALSPNIKAPIWLAVGRLAPVKAFDRLIEAFQFCPGTLLIAGDGPEHLSLKERIDATGQTGKVRLLGFRTDIPALMTAADGVIISSDREGFSYVCAEALLLGKPVMSTDVPIANEVLPKEHIFNGHEPIEFARFLQQDLRAVAASQAKARAFARDTLSLSAMAANTVSVYQQALDKCAPERSHP